MHTAAAETRPATSATEVCATAAAEMRAASTTAEVCTATATTTAAAPTASTTTAPRSGIGWKRQRRSQDNKRNTVCEL
jgi:hypothetical protein